MGIAWSYRPPAVNAIAALAVAAPVATKAGADAVLAASQPLVPVEEGILKASGRVVMDGAEAYVTYGKDDDGDEKHAPSNQYAVVVHENLENNHPNGGGAKFEEIAMHNSGAAVIGEMALELRKLFT